MPQLITIWQIFIYHHSKFVKWAPTCQQDAVFEFHSEQPPFLNLLTSRLPAATHPCTHSSVPLCQAQQMPTRCGINFDLDRSCFATQHVLLQSFSNWSWRMKLILFLIVGSLTIGFVAPLFESLFGSENGTEVADKEDNVIAGEIKPN